MEPFGLHGGHLLAGLSRVLGVRAGLSVRRLPCAVPRACVAPLTGWRRLPRRGLWAAGSCVGWAEGRPPEEARRPGSRSAGTVIFADRACGSNHAARGRGRSSRWASLPRRWRADATCLLTSWQEPPALRRGSLRRRPFGAAGGKIGVRARRRCRRGSRRCRASQAAARWSIAALKADRAGAGARRAVGAAGCAEGGAGGAGAAGWRRWSRWLAPQAAIGSGSPEPGGAARGGRDHRGGALGAKFSAVSWFRWALRRCPAQLVARHMREGCWRLRRAGAARPVVAAAGAGHDPEAKLLSGSPSGLSGAAGPQAVARVARGALRGRALGARTLFHAGEAVSSAQTAEARPARDGGLQRARESRPTPAGIEARARSKGRGSPARRFSSS